MKDYRAFKRYESHEWEEDKEWMGKRLSFLWNVRYYNPKMYRELSLSEEKNEFYQMNDNEVSYVAQQDHYSVDTEYYERLYKSHSMHEKFIEWKRLKHLLINDFKEFLLKKNCNAYEYLNNKYYLNDHFEDYL